MNIIGNIHSDVGIKKQVNQDAACLKVTNTFIGETALAVVCDGMGGFAEGEVASSSLILAFSEWFETRFHSLLKNGINFEIIRNEWLSIIEDQNKKLCDYGQQHNVKVGSTLTAVLVLGKKYYIVNVGDSRAYEISDALYQLTDDQTLVSQAVKEGKISKYEAVNHPKSHVLSQCVGVTPTVKPDFSEGIYNDTATYMLCSDGFRHELSDEELYSALLPSEVFDLKSTKVQQYTLTETCKSRGEKDNITVVVFRSVADVPTPDRVTQVLNEEQDELNIYIVHSDKKL